ncbi:hypothetical protein LPB86_16200 [Pedobacter sp. MC2016-14]|uniref:hypothetical protein n=1 Tax=Pedobacter sp. MC2016-14 TaxID=2897327 RepID=UPI001E596C01|nr:hypothetical protein [Pedobacter sp. MC2016-14]MCD0489786.1 hypothetical protein [Pedobacter sp. MC2016-14]
MILSLAQDKVFNTLVYFKMRVERLSLNKAAALLHKANLIAVKETGVPITWLNYNCLKTENMPNDALAFNDDQFSDYEMEVLDLTINKHMDVVDPPNVENCNLDNGLEFADLLDTECKKLAFKVAYESYLMLC